MMAFSLRTSLCRCLMSFTLSSYKYIHSLMVERGVALARHRHPPTSLTVGLFMMLLAALLAYLSVLEVSP